MIHVPKLSPESQECVEENTKLERVKNTNKNNNNVTWEQQASNDFLPEPRLKNKQNIKSNRELVNRSYPKGYDSRLNTRSTIRTCRERLQV